MAEQKADRNCTANSRMLGAQARFPEVDLSQRQPRSLKSRCAPVAAAVVAGGVRSSEGEHLGTALGGTLYCTRTLPSIRYFVPSSLRCAFRILEWKVLFTERHYRN